MEGEWQGEEGLCGISLISTMLFGQRGLDLCVQAKIALVTFPLSFCSLFETFLDETPLEP